jgi:ribonuclease HI
MTKLLEDQMCDLFHDLSIPESDLLIVGDGSGTVTLKPCAWFCTSYDHSDDKVWEHMGGTNGGSNNFAELSPYIHALQFHHQILTKRGRNPTASEPCSVLIVSDSEVTVRCGNKEYARNANGALWAAIDWFEKNHYDIIWVHRPRNSNVFLKRADFEAGRLRNILEGECFEHSHIQHNTQKTAAAPPVG